MQGLINRIRYALHLTFFCRTNMQKKIFKKVMAFSELFKGFSNHIHKPASVMPKPQSFARNTEENCDILENFTSKSSFSLN